MNFPKLILLPLLAALALGGCQTVISKKPVGDKAAELKMADWNGKWTDGETVFRLKIKDSKLGLVEVTPVSGKDMPKAGEAKFLDVVFRTLGPYTVASVKEKPSDPGYNFGRVAATDSHIVVFAPDAEAFAAVVKQGKLDGKLDRDSDGKPTGSSIVEGFSEQDFQRLKKQGVDVRGLFGADPMVVLVRVK